MSVQQQLDHLRSLVTPSEAIERDAPGYKDASAPWSVWADQRPPLVIQPMTLESMSKVVKSLYDSNLDFGVRNTGTGSVSARDVILSTHGFKDFRFDEASKTVTLGSGYCWGEVDALMEKHAPGYQVVGARCSWVGVTGSALVGGLSWLSHEYGMISDPGNLLDMQVVLSDGRALWASEEPDLMWALRGGGGNFGGESTALHCGSNETWLLTELQYSRYKSEVQSPRVPDQGLRRPPLLSLLLTERNFQSHLHNGGKGHRSKTRNACH